jgi:hypothetical protein
VLRRRWLGKTLSARRFAAAVADLASLPADRYPVPRPSCSAEATAGGPCKPPPRRRPGPSQAADRGRAPPYLPRATPLVQSLQVTTRVTAARGGSDHEFVKA